ncbi:hypothetical protein E2C01_006587 [Portunus trituberculatus]|uniref:Uncharacterized protein n=1 Tax=Portunus trituberculatus TaxID=210409 RepID=A0A5B7CWN5_PORTR|nr:hypothetical protein [Portunus trituberculatus]
MNRLSASIASCLPGSIQLLLLPSHFAISLSQPRGQHNRHHGNSFVLQGRVVEKCPHNKGEKAEMCLSSLLRPESELRHASWKPCRAFQEVRVEDSRLFWDSVVTCLATHRSDGTDSHACAETHAAARVLSSVWAALYIKDMANDNGPPASKFKWVARIFFLLLQLGPLVR